MTRILFILLLALTVVPAALADGYAPLAPTLPPTESRFLFVDPKTLSLRKEAVLGGDFSYDALSPDGGRLYLIQHRNVLDQIHYVVRAYDVRSETLLPGRVADRTQK